MDTFCLVSKKSIEVCYLGLILKTRLLPLVCSYISYKCFALWCDSIVSSTKHVCYKLVLYELDC